MPIPTTIAQQERFHDLINLHLYLQVELFRGQTDRYRFLDADIEIARTGNPFQWGTSASTYSYSIDGPGFALCLRAVYPEPDDATAAVSLLSITPDTDHAREACDAWVGAVLDSKVPPRDLYQEMVARLPMTEADLQGLSW